MEGARAVSGALSAARLFSVAGKTALISGGGRGIGEILARTLVENGCTVYISSRSAETLSRTAARLSSVGPGTCHALPADLSTEEGCLQLAADVRKQTSALHILVNNSGISWGEALSTFPAAQFDRAELTPLCKKGFEER